MTSQIRSSGTGWLARRFHPVTRRGYTLMVDGGKRGSNAELGAGIAMVVAGFALQRRQRPPRLLYRTTLDPGEGIAIRLLDNGEVISETVVPGPDA